MRDMKTEPMPHESLTWEEIKEKICHLQLICFELKKTTREPHTEDVLNRVCEEITTLKKHFCPEKFSVMKITLAELSDMMRYPDDV